MEMWLLGSVAPAVDLVRFAARCGAVVVEVKRTPSLLTSSAIGVVDMRIASPAEEAIPNLATALLGDA